MASRNSDVTLVVRARDEAQKTINNVTGALNKLLGVQQKVSGSAADTGSNIAELGKVLATLDKAYASISGSAANAATGFERQQRAIGEQRAQLAAVQQQATAAAAAMAKLNSADAIVNAGRDQAPRLAQLKLATDEYQRLQREAGKLATSVARQEDALGTSASSLQRVSSQANAVEDAVTRARVAIEAQTRALREQAAAEQVAGRVNAVTGVQRGSATDNGAGFEALAQREIALQEQREQAARSAAAAVRASVETNTGVGRTAATDSGATFSALAAREQETALRAAAQAHQMFEARVRQGAQAMREEARAAADLDDYIREIREQIDPAARSQRYLAEQQAKLNAAFKAGKIDAREYDAALKLVNQSAKQMRDRPQIQLFGLRPYETQNLLFQFNDIVTQLGSGASLSQTLAQQGGQILQLFPRVGASIAAAFSSGPVLAFGTALASVIVLLNRAASEADRVRQATGLLSSSASGGDYNAKNVAAATKQFERYGIAAEDAVKMVRMFVNNGLPEERFLSFGKAAENLSNVLGIDVVDAARQLGDAFNGTYEGISNLDNATNLLTATERDRVRVLFEQGRAQDAMKVAFDALSDRLERGAQDMKGPWADATRALGNAWSDLLDTLSNFSLIQQTNVALETLGLTISNTLDRLRGIRNVNTIMREIQQAELTLKNLTEDPGADILGIGARRIAALKEELKSLNEELERTRRGEGAGSGVGRANAQPGSLNVPIAPAQAPGFGTDPQLKKQSDEKLREMSREQQLQALREKGTKAVNNLRTRNEQFLTDAEKRRREALAGELAATKAIGDQRVKDAARAQAIQEERSRIQQEQDSFNTAATTPQMLARQFVAGREGFRSSAYWDVNAFRVGFGSDTVTRADGSVSRVTQNTTVTLEDAIRDLDRRIGEFQNAIKATIGTERFNSFSPQQQAAITSVAYNYGKLPERIVAAVRSGTSAEIATAIEGLGNDNRGVNRARRNLEASTFRTSNVALEQNTVNQQEDQAAAQQKFSSEIDSANKKLEQRTRLLNEQAGLQDEALLQAQAQAAADEAELALREKLKQTNEQRIAQHKEVLTLTEAEVVATRKAASEAVLNAKAVADARRQAAQRPVDELTGRRDALQAQITFNSEQGNTQAVGRLTQELAAVNAQLVDAYGNLIKFWEGVAAGGDAAAAKFGMTAAAVANLVTQLKTAQAQTAVAGDTSRKFLQTGQQINEQFANGAANAFDRFAQSVAEGKNVFQSFRQAFLQMAADFLRQIAQMIIKQAIFNAIGGAGGNGGLGGGIAGLLGGLFGGNSFATGARTMTTSIAGIKFPFFHEGGVVGSGGDLRLIDPSWFANARRYHTGGVAGLAPDEVPAVLRRGEEVLTADDPRHRANGGGGGAAPQIKVINAIDAGDMVSQGLNTKAGEQAILNFMRNNPGAVRAAMG